MKLIVGLGNPGKDYENTRHNIGFIFLKNYIDSKKIVMNKKKFDGIFCQEKVNNNKVIFLMPQSYINLSGKVIKSFVDYYDININGILIISDDLDLPVGKYRLKSTGSSGGHNGLKSIEAYLGTQDYKRLKIGISNDKKIDTKDYVLGKIDDKTKEEFHSIMNDVNNIIDDFFDLDFDKLMSKYNHK